MWAAQIPVLAERYRVLAPDLPGYGDAPLAPGPLSNVAEVVGFLDDQGIGAAAFVGASFGGRVALEVATAHPDRVTALVLLCPGLRGVAPTAASEAFDEEEERLIEAGDVDGAVALNVDTFLGPEGDATARALLTLMQKRAFDVQIAADLADPGPEPRRVEVDPTAIAVPTVVVSGAHDLDHFGEVAALLGEQIPGAETVELDWAGHLPALERPDAVLALLLDVLRDDPTVHAP